MELRRENFMLFIILLLNSSPLALALTCNVTSCEGLLTGGILSGGIMDYSCFGSSVRQEMDFVETATYDGHPPEVHYVTTTDGYILTIYRIRKAGCPADDKDPMVLAHGLFLSSDFWIIPGPNKSHPYIYVELCYDVWFINVRGNKYGRNHTTKNPDLDPTFWDFDFDEMALKDLPACLDYVLEITGRAQVIYIAHSQGMTMLYVLLSLIPEYNDVINVSFGMSSTAYLNHSTMPVLEFGQLTTIPVGLLLELGFNVEILRHGGVLQVTAEVGCGTTSLTYPICSIFVFFFFGYNEYQITCPVLLDVVGHEPSGTSLKLFQRWNVIKEKGFTQRDTGTGEPAEYPLKNIRAPMIFYISKGDNVSTLEDMLYFFTKLSPDVYKYCVASDESIGHIDFILGKSLDEYFASSILNYLENGTLICV